MTHMFYWLIYYTSTIIWCQYPLSLEQVWTVFRRRGVV